MRQLSSMRDLFGISHRGAFAGSLLAHLEELDLLEILTDSLFDADRATLRAMRALARRLPVVLHGVSLGLCSAYPVDRKRLDATARVVDALEPVAWSEHLAFVRAGGIELGHLAAPPRTHATMAGTAENVARAARIVGSVPRLENIATVLVPPGHLDEPTFVRAVLDVCDAPLLLDLHNLYTNCVNTGADPQLTLRALPLERVVEVHLAGGRAIVTRAGRNLWVDDHLHDTPPVVFELLELLGTLCPQSLTVILERDGHFPRFEAMLAEIQRAREALARGRSARRSVA